MKVNTYHNNESMCLIDNATQQFMSFLRLINFSLVQKCISSISTIL